MGIVRGYAVKIVGGVAILGLAVTVGYLAAPALQASIPGASVPVTANTTSKDMTYGSAGGAPSSLGVAESQVSPPNPDGSAPTASVDSAQRMVVSSTSMEIRVKDAEKAIAEVRALAAATKSEISNLVVTSGDFSPQPMPLASDGSGVSVSGPVSAQVTLRVPADALPAVERDIAKLGTVLSLNVSEDDVTQQHVDMAARLKNLRAEEARLRTFLTRTGKVSELLEVERELARVRGEIESMQAQLTYLERQAAMATLTLSLSEPGPVVSPGTGGWGLGGAVTDGVRTAAALVRATITVAIPLALIGVIGGAIALVWRSIRRRRKPTHAEQEESQE
jgi:hypothetical protein